MNNIAFGYNTNGFANHALMDVFSILAALGYKGVAITLDHNHCNPHRITQTELDAIRRRLEELKLRTVIETGARYFLDPWNKHEPSLISEDGRERRISFIKDAINIASFLNSEVVAICSGKKRHDIHEEKSWEYLGKGVTEILDYAEKKNVVIAIEPEPGMFIGSLQDYEELHSTIPEAKRLFLTLDIGHIYCSESCSAPELIQKYRDVVRNIHIEDIKDGVHEHLSFGEGDIDFKDVMDSLKKVEYAGLVNVELSRDSHRAVEMARKSVQFLKSFA